MKEKIKSNCFAAPAWSEKEDEIEKQKTITVRGRVCASDFCDKLTPGPAHTWCEDHNMKRLIEAGREPVMAPVLREFYLGLMG